MGRAMSAVEEMNAAAARSMDSAARSRETLERVAKRGRPPSEASVREERDMEVASLAHELRVADGAERQALLVLFFKFDRILDTGDVKLIHKHARAGKNLAGQLLRFDEKENRRHEAILVEMRGDERAGWCPEESAGEHLVRVRGGAS